MECWTQNNWRTPQHGTSKGCDKQTDDFQATFPNFMTLTDEERHAFFQTLYAAKVKLENSGVTVKPFFGTVHDQSWNTDALLNKSSVQDDGYISRVSKTPTQYQSNLSLDSFSPVDSINLIRNESSKKILKEDELFGEFSQENLEVLGRNDSLESLGFDEKEVEVTSFNEIFRNTMKIPKANPVISSVSYEILNKGDVASIYQQQKEDTLKIKGTKLKVQVTLTSGDNERMRKTLYKPKRAQTNGVLSESFKQRSGKISPKENKKKRYEDVKFAEERIDDLEVKDLLNVEKESVEDLPEEAQKPLLKLIRKRSSEGKRKELFKFENDLYKAERGKKEVEDQLSLKQETEKERTLQERSKTKILIGKEKPQKEQNNKEIVKNNSNVSIESLFKPKDEAKEQSILAMTTVKKETGPSTKLEQQEAEVVVKNRINRQAERQKRVEKLKKCLQKRELAYQKMMKRKDELKAQGKEKSADLKKESTSKEDVKIEKNPISPNLESKEETPSTSEKKSVVVACTEETKEEKKSAEAGAAAGSDPAYAGDAAGAGAAAGSDPAYAGDAAGAGAAAGSDPAYAGDAAGAGAAAGSDPAYAGDAAGAGAVAGCDPAQIGDPAGTIQNSGEEKALESTKTNLKDIKECVTPFKPGKVVFVDDNVIEKIRNVILDLEKQAKGEDSAENEYLVLLVDYVEYLSTVMATLFEKRVTKPPDENPNVRFDEENFKEIKQVLRASTSTTEDELESNEQLEIRKKRKKNKPRKASLIKRLGKCFRCGKSKKNKKAGSSSSGSSP